jgi:L-threonylcarbamoyladenylate synthase
MEGIDQAVGHLRSGEVVGVPTDTVYGIAADPHQPAAVELLFSLKGRRGTKPIGVLLADRDAARSMVMLPLYALEWTERFWPGPLTLVARSMASLPVGVGDRRRRSVGVRVPDHSLTLALLQAYGPLAVTSANRAGGSETLNDSDARSTLGDLVPYYLRGDCPGALASTVVDVTRDKPRILREGPLDLGLG